MNFWTLVRIANRNLFRNKLRTFLTVAAIFVGSFTLTMTNGIGDGMRNYVESQVKNFESDNVMIVRRQISNEDPDRSPGAAKEYKDESSDDANAPIDKDSVLVTLPQIESAIKTIDGVKTVTPRYNVAAEYLSIDNQKKYEISLAMMSEGIRQKTEAGRSLQGVDEIVIPLGLARTLDEKIEHLIGKLATIGFKGADDKMQTIRCRRNSSSSSASRPKVFKRTPRHLLMQTHLVQFTMLNAIAPGLIGIPLLLCKW